jgi:flagellar biosynthetic protein FliR
MLSLDPFINHLVPFFLVVTRLGGLFIFTPLLANQTLPRRFRVMLAVMFSAAVYPGLPAAMQTQPDVSIPGLIPLFLAELLIGAAMGFIAGLPIISLDMAGVIMGHQMGMGLGRVYNPDLGADTDSIGQVLMYVALASYLALGGLDAMFLALVYTFAKVPVGAMTADGAVPLDAIVGVLTSGTELGLRVAAPVLCIVLLLMIGIGLLGKTMPQINVLSVGFTLKLFLGLGMLAASMATIQQVSAEEVERVVGWVVQWGKDLSPPGESGQGGP